VADAARARLFQYDGFGIPLKMLKEWQHAESRAKIQDLVTDRPGRVMQSHSAPHPGHGSRSGTEPEVSPKRLEHEHFARQLIDELDHGLGKNAYGRLILIANPEFLGLLRRAASSQVLKRTVASLDKDYTMLPIKELEQHLTPLLRS
jgi:protein required for attachment to host cells